VFGDFGLPDAVTEQGQDNMVWLWRIFLIGAFAVAGLIWVLVITSILRFRRRSDEIPNQRQYNIPFEIGYTVAPLVVVAILFGLTVYAQDGFTSLSDDPDLEVEVEGFQWQWRFDYLDDEVVINGSEQAPATVVLPVGRTIRFHLVSNDVNHSFWVPEFLEKRDLIPGIDNQIDVNITQPGQWIGRCAEYCGLDHWKMTFDVIAVPGDEYEEWLAEAKTRPQPLVMGTPDVPLPSADASNTNTASGGGGS
jgi:cytochrome c oxidase subunit II